MRNALIEVSTGNEEVPMPYLRLYTRKLPIEQKRVIARNLIEITLRTLKLRPEQRYQTTVQFITVPRMGCSSGLPASICEAEFTLEVLGRGLTEPKERAFAEEATAMLEQLKQANPWSRFARLLRREAAHQVAFQFSELSPAVSEPFVVGSQYIAA
jgi:hypothetical protein